MISVPFDVQPETPPLDRAEVHVWLVEAPGDATPRSLSGYAHATLGRLLARYADLPEPPTLVRDEHGKPHAPDLHGIDFNLSHSGKHALIAVAIGQPLGVDIEMQGRARSIEEIAQRYFAPSEAMALQALPPDLRDAAFLRLWTGKEAVLKAIGQGLSFGLDRVEFELDQFGQLGALRRVQHDQAQTKGWHWHALQPLQDHHGAIAWHGPPRRLRLMRAP